MKQKQKLLHFIKTKGKCPAERGCAGCPILTYGDQCNVSSRCKQAIGMYIKEYGKDEDLLEVLI